MHEVDAQGMVKQRKVVIVDGKKLDGDFKRKSGNSRGERSSSFGADGQLLGQALV